ncbi:MFS transporter [Desulfosporosinus fructosivorans]
MMGLPNPNTDRRAILLSLPKPYLTFLIGLLISRLGDSLYTFAIPWISYELTQSAVVMGSIYAVGVLPIVLFGPVIGVVVDHWDRRRLMLSADVARAFLIALVPILHLLDSLELWHLYVISFVVTILSLMFDVTTVTAIPHIAGKDLTKANASNQLVNQIADMLGPIFAGVIIAAVGGFNTLWLDVLSFAATFLAVMWLPSLKRVISPKDDNLRYLFREMGEGFRWLIRDRLNLTLSLQAMIGNFGYTAVFAVLMYYLLSILHLDAKQSSFNYSLIGVGGLIGSLIIVPLERRFRRGVLIPALLMMGTVGFIYASVSNFWLAPGIAFGAVTACNVAWNTLVTSVRQETVPPDMLGRVLGFSRVFTRLAMPLGGMVGALISSNFNPAAVFLVAAVAKSLEVVIALTSRIRKM